MTIALTTDRPSDVIRAFRGAADLTQENLAERLRVDRAIVSRLESGGRPSRTVRERLAMILGCDPYADNGHISLDLTSTN